LDVEGRWFVEAAHGVIKQDVCVLEEPGRNDQGQWNAQQSGFGGEGENEGEHDDDAGGSAAGGAEEVADDLCVRAYGFRQ